MKIIGTDRRSLPVQVHPVSARPAAAFETFDDQGRLDFKVILIHREPNEVVAYRGSGSDEWVASHGDKLSIAAASAHFPALQDWLSRAGAPRYDE